MNRRAIGFISISFVFALCMSVGLLQLTQTTAQSAALALDFLPSDTLVITKTVEGGAADTSWEFTIEGTDIFSTVLIPGAGGSQSLQLPPGSYAVTETPKEGYYVSDIFCQSDLQFLAAVNGFPHSTVVDIGEVGDACEFVNTKFAILTVVKDAQPDSDQEFEFFVQEPDVITPTSFSLVDDGTGISNTKTFTDLLDGMYYSIYELGTDNWVPDGVACVDSNGPVPPTYPVGAAAADEIIDKSSQLVASWQLMPEVGETYTCTFTNLGAQLAMTKTVTTEPNECAPVSLDSCVFPGTEVYYCYEVENTGAVTVSGHSLVDNVFDDIFTDVSYDLAPGQKVNSIDVGHVITSAPTVSVSNVATWTGVYTYSPEPVRFVGAEVQPSLIIDSALFFMTGTVNVTDTASVDVCEPSRIVVDKVTMPSDSDQVFDFVYQQISDPSASAMPFTVTATSNYTTPDLKPGTYGVAELTTDGWATVGTPTCTDDAGAPYDAAAIDLPAGVTVTCVFTNEQMARIFVDKVTSPAGSTTEFNFSFTDGGELNDTFSLTDSDAPWDSGWIYSGAYSVSETPLNGWTLDSATCDNGDSVDDIFADYGEEITCTFNNRQDPTSLEVGPQPEGTLQLYLPQMAGGE